MIRRAATLSAMALVLAGCSSAPMRDLQQLLWISGGMRELESGLAQYENGQHAEAARNLQAALNLGVPASQRALAHKHLAFIHCASGRQAQCREEFRKALASDATIELTAAEAGHPVWGPVFRSLKAGEPPLAVGLRQYEEGRYEESSKTLQTAIDQGLPDKDRARAHKHLAFMHCASRREKQCRDEFRRALDLDPGLQLTAAEAGHPAWGPVFRSLSKGESAPAAKGGAPLAANSTLLLAGLRQYENGDYGASARTLQDALDQGLSGPDRARAHKHLAFMHCADHRTAPCREEFRKALAADPALELSPAEAGHPVWGPLFRAVKAGR
jgi:Tfp pilus assembly protein PilF